MNRQHKQINKKIILYSQEHIRPKDLPRHPTIKHKNKKEKQKKKQPKI